jgi:hypothetical protein
VVVGAKMEEDGQDERYEELMEELWLGGGGGPGEGLSCCYRGRWAMKMHSVF